MKLLEINVCSGCKSTGRIASDIAKEFVAMGNEAMIAYGRGYLDCGIQTYKICSNNAVKLDALKTRIFDNAGFNNKRATKRFIEWVRAYDPDIIHLHNVHGYYINVELLFQYLKGCGKKILWTLHDCWAFTGHCAYFDYAGCEKWKEGCRECPSKKDYPTSNLLDASKRNYERKKALFTGIPNLSIVTPSRWLADLVKESFLMEYPTFVINNGIDLESFKPTESDLRKRYGVENKKILLGVASPWSARKGFDDFVRLSDTLSDDYRIVLIGLNEKQMERCTSRMIGIQRTDSKKELAAWYTTADVFVNPTYEDNYPTVNLEAQACGTPVITYRTGGSVESVPADYVVGKGDLQALLEKIDAVLRAETAELVLPKSAKESCDEYVKLLNGCWKDVK